MVVCNLEFLIIACLEPGGADASKIRGQRLPDLVSSWRVTISLFILEAVRGDGEPSESES
jgi:hypothetical protein